MKLLCISASNNYRKGMKETSSLRICRRIVEEVKKKAPCTSCDIIELKEYELNPCTNCLTCLENKRCVRDGAFNGIYERIIDCDVLFIVSPHYAPIPAKLCMVLEKMESISFNPWLKDNSYQSEVYDIATGLISHGGTGEDWALREYKRVVNDPIANALATIQLKLVPFNDQWKTGISIPPLTDSGQGSMLEEYIDKVIHYNPA